MRASKSSKSGSAAGTFAIASRIKEAGPSAAGAVQQYGPRQLADSFKFVVFFPQATTVQIAGDFNNWQPAKTPMKKTGNGVWEITFPLTKGTYRYRYVVDGRWQNDPHNNMTEPNPYGELNSIIKVI